MYAVKDGLRWSTDENYSQRVWENSYGDLIYRTRNGRWFCLIQGCEIVPLTLEELTSEIERNCFDVGRVVDMFPELEDCLPWA